MKRFPLVITLFALIFISACSKPPTPPIEAAISQGVPAIEKEAEKKDYLGLLKEGKGDNIDFPIGTSAETIISKWGDPQVKDHFSGGTFLTYENVTFFTDSSDINGKVVVIAISENTDIFGVKVGMTFDEIKKILGEPRLEIKSDSEDELYSGDWCLVYENGNYKVTFMSKDKISSTYAAYIEKVNNN